MSNADPPDVVESGCAGPSDASSELPTLASFFRRRILFGVLAVVLVVGGVAVASRSDAHAIVPDLVGVRVDPQLDALRLRLEAADLALGDVTVGPCPSTTSPGSRSSRSRARSSTSTPPGELRWSRPPRLA
jgi:hypothetical protein